MAELPTLALEDIARQRGRFGLLVLDENAITCQKLIGLKELGLGLGEHGVLMMLEEQYKRGLRGFAKAQILGSVVPNLEGVLPVGADNFMQEIIAGWGTVKIPEPVMFRKEGMVVHGGRKEKIPEFPIANSEADQKWMNRAVRAIAESNCWYYPAGCVFVIDNQLLIEAAATNYNNSQCASIPLDFTELPLNQGERLSFCDSQHAEREGIARASRQKITLEGSTLYISKFPCRPCIQSLLGAGIAKVVFDKGSYGLVDSQLLIDNGVEIRKIAD